MPRLIANAVASLFVALLVLLSSSSSSGGAPLPMPSPLQPSRPSDALALLAFKAAADPSGGLLPFYNLPPAKHSLPLHCRWAGVSCSPAGRVVRLVFEAAALNGTFAAGTLDRLDQLRVLSLQNNWLVGPIPDLSKLVNLKALYLAHNLLDGPFPVSVLSLHRLRVLDLSYNRLSGGIPPSLAELDRIFALRLDSNRFNGSVPPFNQTSLKKFNVSSNNLSGAIPVTFVLSSFGPSAFAGNLGLCGEVVKKECSSHFQFFHSNASAGGAPVIAPPSPVSAAGKQDGMLLHVSGSPARKMHRKTVMAIGFLAGIFMVLGILGVSLAVKRKVKQPQLLSPEKNSSRLVNGVINLNVENYNEEIESTNNELAAAAALATSEEKMKKLGKSGCLVFCAGEAQVYTLEQLMRASAELLGRGSVGTTYKAVLDNRLIVCVKRLDATKLGAAGKEAFERQMDTVGRLRHPNLVPLRAFFQAKEERLLVYDYQPNGSLHSLIHGSRSTRAKPLHWTSCLKIAEDVAQGLAYIHQASRLVHGNIRASNVLLGSDFEACLTDNGLSFLLEPLVGGDDSGYRAPETQLTPRSDIYAFGVLLLELLTGKSPSQHPVLATTDLLTWVRSVRADEGNEDERLMMIIDIAVACVRSSPDSRPTTWQVLKMIQEVKEVDNGDNDSDSTSIS